MENGYYYICYIDYKHYNYKNDLQFGELSLFFFYPDAFYALSIYIIIFILNLLFSLNNFWLLLETSFSFIFEFYSIILLILFIFNKNNAY